MEYTKITIETTTFGAELCTAILMDAGVKNVEVIDPADKMRYLGGIERTWDYIDESLIEDAHADAHARVVFYLDKDDALMQTDDGVALSAVVVAMLADIRTRLDEIKPEFPEDMIGSLDMSVEDADDAAWIDEWKKHFKPLHIGRVTVVPEWIEYKPKQKKPSLFQNDEIECCGNPLPITYKNEEIIFKIDPGSAFGTGQHQTTQLCIQALQQQLNPGDKVADIGCGSGILSVISLLLGAGYVYATDIDPAGAMSATKKNAVLNNISLEQLFIKSGNLLEDDALLDEMKAAAHAQFPRNKLYDIVVANIVADVIIPLTHKAKSLLTNNGLFVSSGIITERLDEVLHAYQKAGFNVVEQFELEGWHCVVGLKHDA